MNLFPQTSIKAKITLLIIITIAVVFPLYYLSIHYISNLLAINDTLFHKDYAVLKKISHLKYQSFLLLTERQPSALKIRALGELKSEFEGFRWLLYQNRAMAGELQKRVKGYERLSQVMTKMILEKKHYGLDGLLNELVRQLQELYLIFEQKILAQRNKVVSIGDNAYRVLITGGLISVFVLILILLTLPKRIVQPLRRLESLFCAAQEGDLTIKADIQTNDETRRLVTSFNKMLKNLCEIDKLKSQRIQIELIKVEAIKDLVDSPFAIVDRDFHLVEANKLFLERAGLEKIDKQSLSSILHLGHDEMQKIREFFFKRESADLKMKIEKWGREYRLKLRYMRDEAGEMNYLIILFL